MVDPEGLLGAPLQPVSPEKINQQRESSLFYSTSSRPDHDTSVHDKISQFNTLSMQSRQLERKTADAALKRAMLGREEAESDMRRYRDEVRSLRKQLDDGRERERRVGERLETVMENYGRTKETHAHTQALWEKEVRRSRKETFKAQSSVVKLQEELKSARSTLKSTEEGLEREKERSKVREQEAFAARYQLVGVQEQVDKALDQIRQVEQERDAYKTIAQNEEVARIAAEGRLPLPPAPAADDEFASPKKARARISISTLEIQSSAASEAEIQELSSLLSWEKQRATRAIHEIEFLKAECELKCCPCSRELRATAAMPPPPSRPAVEGSQPVNVEIVDAADFAVLGMSQARLPKQRNSHINRAEAPRPRMREARRSTIFIPSEGTFRTVSQVEADALAEDKEVIHVSAEEDAEEEERPVLVESDVEPRAYARTPSVDPPTFALLAQERASLQSLLDAPHQDNGGDGVSPTLLPITRTEQQEPCAVDPDTESSSADVPPPAHPTQKQMQQLQQQQQQQQSPQQVIDETATPTPAPEVETRPHTSAAFYTVTQTTTVPLRVVSSSTSLINNSKMLTNSSSGQRLRTPKSGSFDVNNPALTPTMTRDEALAQIRERRGRARSMANGTMTPRRQMARGVGERRDVSAPVGRGG